VLAGEGKVVPRAGTPTPERLAEALGALELELGEDDLAALADAVPPDAVAGERYPAQGMATLDSERT
jgi:aryl-alcohol dehydrogenase-like predicted oxidoreductase